MINSSYKLALWADVLYACDDKWWEYHDGANDFQGLKFTQSIKASKEYGITHIPGCNISGLSLDPSVIHYGENSGYQALNLACHFRPKKILLIGYDMQMTDGKRHFFGDHPEGLHKPLERRFTLWCRKYQTTVSDLETLGIEVVNCTTETALTCFRRSTLDKEL